MDGLVEGDLERHLRAQPDVSIDYDAWAARASSEGLALLKPRRGEVARAASHCQAWRLGTTSGTDHLLVLEDGVEAPDLADAVALLLSELPEDYDLLYLCVPPVPRRREGRGSRRPMSVPALSACVPERYRVDRPLGERLSRPISGVSSATGRLRGWRRRLPGRRSFVLSRQVSNGILRAAVFDHRASPRKLPRDGSFDVLSK